MLAGTMLFAAGTVSADVYKWVDDKGQVHYSDRASAPSADKVKLPVAPPSAQPARNPAATSDEAAQLKMEYQQRRDQENAQQLQEQEAKRHLQSERETKERAARVQAEEAARRKAVVEDCKATMRLRICSKGYDAIMEEHRRRNESVVVVPANQARRR
jgi:Skp family chaperone for outer membrane proteins